MRQSGRALLLRSRFSLRVTSGDPLEWHFPRRATARTVGPDELIFGELFAPFLREALSVSQIFSCTPMSNAREPKPRAWYTEAPPDIMIVVLPKKLAAVDLGIFAYEIVLVSWSARAIL